MKKSKDLRTIIISLTLLILEFFISYLLKYSILSYFVINISLLFYTIAVFISAIYEKNNESKIIPSAFIIIFSGAGIFINLYLYGKNTLNINNHFIIGWCSIWGIICFAGTVFLFILIVQLTKYTKETYTEIQNIRAQNRKSRTQAKTEYKDLKAKLKWEHKGKLKTAKLQIQYDSIIEREKQKQAAKTEKQKNPLINRSFNYFSKKWCSIKAIFLLVLFICVYIILPLLTMNKDSSTNLLKILNLDTWLENITFFINKFFDKGTNISSIDAIFRYTMGYIAIIGFLFSLIFIIYNIIENHPKILSDKETEQGFFKTYTMPIIILAFASAILSTFVQSDDSGFLENILESLLKAIFALIELFICIEIVRLIKEQCTEPKSILRQCIQYLYVLVTKSVMDVVIGILSGIDLKGLIESALSSILPNRENALNQKIEQYLEEDFDSEVENIKEQGYLTIKKRIRKQKSKKISLRRK